MTNALRARVFFFSDYIRIIKTYTDKKNIYTDKEYSDNKRKTLTFAVRREMRVYICNYLIIMS